MAKYLLFHFLDFIIKRSKFFTLFIYKIDFSNCLKTKTISKLITIKNMIFKLC